MSSSKPIRLAVMLGILALLAAYGFVRWWAARTPPPLPSRLSVP